MKPRAPYRSTPSRAWPMSPSDRRRCSPATTAAIGTAVWARASSTASTRRASHSPAAIRPVAAIAIGGSPYSIIRTTFMRCSPRRFASLAVAATDGTVQRRFQNGTVAGQALLKTGSLEGVRALAGYVIDAEGRRFVVVAIINHHNALAGAAALDNLVQWVYQNGATWNAALQH